MNAQTYNLKRLLQITTLIILLLSNICVLADYEVKIVYFIPTDSVDKSKELDLNNMMKSIRLTYLDEMNRHGFPGKTFNLEIDNNGKVVIHKVNGDHNQLFYRNGTLFTLQKELENKGYNDRQSIYAVVMAGMNRLPGGASGLAVAYPWGAWFNNSEYYGYCISIESTKQRTEGILRHEIGHCFGLSHLVLDNPVGFIMANGDKLVFHEARWLSKIQYFNDVWKHNLGPEIVKFHGAENEPDGKIRITADVRDPDGLFQSYGFVQTPTPAGFGVVGFNFYDRPANAIAHFSDIDRHLLEKSDEIWLQLMDIHGNWRLHNPNTYTLPEPLNKNEDIAWNISPAGRTLTTSWANIKQRN